jgi:hypothetical protein
MLRLHGRTDDWDSARRIVWACTLAPGAVTDYTPLLQLADRIFSTDTPSFLRPPDLSPSFYAITLGRSGRWTDAVAKLEHALKEATDEKKPVLLLRLALALQGQGEKADARRRLQEATAVLNREQAPVHAVMLVGWARIGPLAAVPLIPPQASDPLRGKLRWADFLELRLLRDEAQKTITVTIP